VTPLITSTTDALAGVTSTTTPAVTTAAQTLMTPVTGTGGQSAVGLQEIARSLQAGGASAAGAAALSAGLSSQSAAPGGDTPAPSVPMLPRLPVIPGGGPNGPAGSGGPGGTTSGPGGGNGGGAAQGGASAALRTLILLRLAHYAAAKPIWHSYLPEVPPA
jgi:hypothetical protein